MMAVLMARQTLRLRAPVSKPFYPRRAFSSSRLVASAPRRSSNFSSGFSSSYDPTVETGRGPIFNSASVGVPQFYPRDLKKRVDDYVVGQDRAKKTICSVIFNHYQSLRRRARISKPRISGLRRKAASAVSQRQGHPREVS